PDLPRREAPRFLRPLTPNVQRPEHREGERLPLRANKPCGVRVRCRNTSVKPWALQAGANAGIHAAYCVDDATGKLIDQGRSGMFDAVVPPGEAIDLTLAIAGLNPGDYLLRVDMTDEQHAPFLQLGSRPLFV